ncbi:hypothetical protein [Tranquillimonas rosea]|uniref:hypothetical protein n=1 Tax=Tranquillimonas rosea TaxID=641238 RepID=UPI0011603FD7|nr:hypothetical protein [Tranquillimonas rosea]
MLGQPTIEDAQTAISLERQRQITQEGWHPEHDDAWVHGELLNAALCYSHHDMDSAEAGSSGKPPSRWPFDPAWWKPKDRHRNLVRAGALCLAEKERCERARLPTGEADRELDRIVREIAARGGAT